MCSSSFITVSFMGKLRLWEPVSYFARMVSPIECKYPTCLSLGPEV